MSKPVLSQLSNQPAPIRELIEALIADGGVNTFRLSAIDIGDGVSAVDQDVSRDDVPTTITVVSRDFNDVHVKLTFTASDVQRASRPEEISLLPYSIAAFGVPVPDWESRTAEGQARSRQRLEVLDTAAQKLLKDRFCLVAANLEGRKRWLTFVKGSQVSSDGPTLGVRAEINWCVC